MFEALWEHALYCYVWIGVLGKAPDLSAWVIIQTATLSTLWGCADIWLGNGEGVCQ